MRSISPRQSDSTSCHPQQGNNLNLILLGSDTFRADNLAGYGSQWIECPNLNRFAHVVSGYGWIACVRDQQWNFSEVWNPTAYRGNYPPQLYDVESDRQELTNVAEKHPDVVRKLSSQLKEYMASGDGITRGSFHERESGGRTSPYTQDD